MTRSFAARAAAILLAAGAIGAFGATQVYAHPTIDIVASNWKFTPNTITIPAGEETTLSLTSSGGVHGIQSDELGIPLTTIRPGSYSVVKFTPKKAGKYIVPCAVVCGPGHADMKLTVIVQ